jgi:hypothetical protein
MATWEMAWRLVARLDPGPFLFNTPQQKTLSCKSVIPRFQVEMQFTPSHLPE